MRRKRLGQQMAAWTPLSAKNGCTQLCIDQAAFLGHQQGGADMPGPTQDQNAHIGAVEQHPQVQRPGLIMREHQQAEEFVQRRFVSEQGIAVEPFADRGFGRLAQEGGARCGCGIEQECAKDQTFERIVGRPANGAVQSDGADPDTAGAAQIHAVAGLQSTGEGDRQFAVASQGLDKRLLPGLKGLIVSSIQHNDIGIHNNGTG